jgi:uncharacterized membrane protein YoaT (DUF817 family)
MLTHDYETALDMIYGRKPKKLSLKQRIIRLFTKAPYEHYMLGIRWQFINITCLLFGHKWKLLFKPDMRKGRLNNAHFHCTRCCRYIEVEHIHNS